jgi:glutaminyl-tRNA synthetase
MGLIKPLKIILSGRPKDISDLDVPDFPFDVNRGSHKVTIEDEVYIDMTDFRMIDDNDYYGLAPHKVVSLKYAFKIRCEKVDTNAAGEPVLLHCSYYDGEDKAKTAIQWVSATSSVKIEVRMYDHLFLIEEPTDSGWEKELNPNSEEVYGNALVDASFLNLYSKSVTHFQFERIGFFTIDPDTVIDNNNFKNSKFVCNLVVNLKDSKPKVAGAPTKSRKEEQDRLAAEKLVFYYYLFLITIFDNYLIII